MLICHPKLLPSCMEPIWPTFLPNTILKKDAIPTYLYIDISKRRLYPQANRPNSYASTVSHYYQSGLTAAFSAIERWSGLTTNEGKTKYMLQTDRVIRRIGFYITTDNYTFDIISEFVSLDSAITIKNDVSLHIRRRITLANRYFYGFNWRLLLLLSVLLSTDAATLRKQSYERSFNNEFYEVLNDVVVVQRINILTAALARLCCSNGSKYSGKTGI